MSTEPRSFVTSEGGDEPWLAELPETLDGATLVDLARLDAWARQRVS